jgi:hypothetical protein
MRLALVSAGKAAPIELECCAIVGLRRRMISNQKAAALSCRLRQKLARGVLGERRQGRGGDKAKHGDKAEG